MHAVVGAAGSAGEASRNVLSGATDVGQQADTLRVQIDHFLLAVRGEAEIRPHVAAAG
jgi:hypothetical protein